MRSVAVQTWPERWNAAVTAAAAATSGSALSITISGSLPPASITHGFSRSPQAAATFCPASTLPVKATTFTRSSAISACAVSAPPVRHDTSPGGRLAKCSMNLSVHSEVAGAGLITTALPTASEAATVNAIRMIGKLYGRMCALMPYGKYLAYCSEPGEVGPARKPPSSRATSA